MNIQIINNKVICNPTALSDIQELHEITSENIVVDFTELDIIEDAYDLHSVKGMLVGCIMHLERTGKNVVVVTKNKIVGGVMNYLNCVVL